MDFATIHILVHSLSLSIYIYPFFDGELPIVPATVPTGGVLSRFPGATVVNFDEKVWLIAEGLRRDHAGPARAGA